MEYYRFMECTLSSCKKEAIMGLGARSVTCFTSNADSKVKHDVMLFHVLAGTKRPLSTRKTRGDTAFESRFREARES